MDIGAHLGLFTIVMARCIGPSGRVFSFEPTPLSRHVLSETVRLNGSEKIVVVRSEAVTGSSGVATFYGTGTNASNANSLVRTIRSRDSITVNTVSLDDFVTAQQIVVRCLKIDVEGSELDLLRGAQTVFKKLRPTAMLSIHPASLQQAGQSLSDLWMILQEYHLSVQLVDDYHDGPWDPSLMTERSFCERQDLFDVGLIPLN